MLFPMQLHAQELEMKESQENWLNQFDFAEIDDMLNEIFPKEKMSFGQLVEKLISGETKEFHELLIKFIIDQLFYEVSASREGIIQILLLVIAAAVFSNFSSMFKSTQVSEISFSVIYLLLIAICMNNFQILVTDAEVNMQRLIHFM